MNSSPTSILNSINQLVKGAEVMMHSVILLRSQVSSLQIANEAASRRKKRLKKRIQRKGVLTQAEGVELATQIGVDRQNQDEAYESGAAAASAQRQKHCRRCGEAGHNLRTCSKDTEVALESAIFFFFDS